MKNIIFTLVLFTLISCSSGIKGEGEVNKKELFMEHDITHLILEGNYEAVLIQEGAPKVVIEAQPNLISNLEIEEEINSLKISEKQKAKTSELYKVYIYSDKLADLELKDDLKFDVSGELKNKEFSLEMMDNTSFMAQVFIEEFDLKAEDNAALILKGNCGSLEAKFKDNSKMISPKFVVNDADIDISDNAELNLQVISQLDGESSDNALIEYKGSPDKDFQTKDQSRIIKTKR